AMSADEHAAALATGARLVSELHGAGIDALIPGEIGIGNTTTAALLAAAFGGTVRVGRGAGADSDALDRKTAVIDAALQRHAAVVSAGEPHAILAALGGLEFSVLAGAYLEA